jgi:hypothetical protein
MRAFALSLPEAEEIETWGHPTFRVRKKLFATMAPDGSDASVKSTLPEQQALIQSQPDVFGIADYVGRHGWISVRLDAVDPDEMRELLQEAWRMTAPKRLLAAFDAEDTPPGP